MGEYVNFIQDFPGRCQKLLIRHYEESRNAGAEVTLMLTIATSGFIIPFARLAEIDHPSGDDEQFKEARAQFNKFINKNFLTSTLVSSQTTSSWRYVEDLTISSGNKTDWSSLRAGKSTISTKPVASILSHIRNALAHSNVFTFENPIEDLIFLSRDKDKDGEYTGMFNLVAVSPEDFRQFLVGWFSFLATLKMPENVQQGDVTEVFAEKSESE